MGMSQEYTMDYDAKGSCYFAIPPKKTEGQGEGGSFQGPILSTFVIEFFPWAWKYGRSLL